MSTYQFGLYSKGQQEIENDKKRGRGKKTTSKKVIDPEKELFEVKSSYRAYSRMHCSFVFPKLYHDLIQSMRKEKREEEMDELDEEVDQKKRG